MKQEETTLDPRATTLAAEESLAVEWRKALLLGGLMGLWLMLAEGMRFPGHRSFIYMLGFGVGLSFTNRTSLLAAGGIAGVCHMGLRFAARWQAPPLDTFDALASPLAVAAVWGLVATRLPNRGRSLWAIPCATVICWLVPLLDVSFDWTTQSESWWAVATGSPKAFVTHPVMGTAGACLAFLFRWRRHA